MRFFAYVRKSLYLSGQNKKENYIAVSTKTNCYHSNLRFYWAILSPNDSIRHTPAACRPFLPSLSAGDGFGKADCSQQFCHLISVKKGTNVLVYAVKNRYLCTGFLFVVQVVRRE